MNIKNIRNQYDKDIEFINNVTDSWNRLFMFKLYGDKDEIKEITNEIYEYPVHLASNSVTMVALIDREEDNIMVFGDDVTLYDITDLLCGYDVVAYGVCVDYNKSCHDYSAIQFVATEDTNAYVSKLIHIDVEDDDVIFDVSNKTMHLYGKIDGKMDGKMDDKRED